jgi:hypothetical protein
MGAVFLHCRGCPDGFEKCSSPPCICGAWTEGCTATAHISAHCPFSHKDYMKGFDVLMPGAAGGAVVAVRDGLAMPGWDVLDADEQRGGASGNNEVIDREPVVSFVIRVSGAAPRLTLAQNNEAVPIHLGAAVVEVGQATIVTASVAGGTAAHGGYLPEGAVETIEIPWGAAPPPPPRPPGGPVEPF